MSFLFASARKDLARWVQDYPAILIWLGIPFLIGGLITAMIDGGNGATPTGTLLIADQDDSLLSGLVAGAYSQGELGELISVQQVTLEAATGLVADHRLPGHDRKPAFGLDGLDQVDGGDEAVPVGDPGVWLGGKDGRCNALNLCVRQCMVEHDVLLNAGSRLPCRGRVPRPS